MADKLIQFLYNFLINVVQCTICRETFCHMDAALTILLCFTT